MKSNSGKNIEPIDLRGKTLASLSPELKDSREQSLYTEKQEDRDLTLITPPPQAFIDAVQKEKSLEGDKTPLDPLPVVEFEDAEDTKVDAPSFEPPSFEQNVQKPPPLPTPPKKSPQNTGDVTRPRKRRKRTKFKRDLPKWEDLKVQKVEIDLGQGFQIRPWMIVTGTALVFVLLALILILLKKS